MYIVNIARLNVESANLNTDKASKNIFHVDVRGIFCYYVQQIILQIENKFIIIFSARECWYNKQICEKIISLTQRHTKTQEFGFIRKRARNEMLIADLQIRDEGMVIIYYSNNSTEIIETARNKEKDRPNQL